MVVQRLAPGHRQRIGPHGLHAELVGAGLDGLFDVGGDAFLELREQIILLVDRQRQQPVQELRHGRQVFLQSALVRQAKPGRGFELLHGPVSDAPEPQRAVELAQRRPGVAAFEVVAFPEQGLAAAHRGLAVPLPAGDGAEAVEPSGDGGDEPALALHVGGHGPEQRRRGLMRAVGAPEPLDRLVGAPARFEQVVHAPFGIAAGEIGMVAAPGAASHREHQHALGPVHECGGFGQVRRRRAGAQRQAFATRIGDAQHPARPAGHLRDRVVPEVLDDLVERSRHRRERGEFLDERIAASQGRLARHGIAVGVEHRPGHQVALRIGERFLQLHRKGMGEELDDGLARGEVHVDVVPLGCRDLGDAPLHQRFPGGDELHDGGTALFKVGLDRADQRGAFHGREQVPEEPLLGALERGHRRGLGVAVKRRLAVDDAGGLQRLAKVGVDDLERAGVGIVDTTLGGAQGVFEDLDLDAVVRERAGLVQSKRLQVAGDDFERGDPARFHRGDELRAGLERRLAGGPKSQAPGVGEAGHGGGAGRGDVGDARVGQRVLQAKPGAALLRRRDFAAAAFGAGGVGHRVRLVEHENPVVRVAVVLVERTGQPFNDLVQSRGLALPGRRAKRRVGREQDAFGKRDLRARAELAERDYVLLAAAQRGTVAARVFQQLVGLREPQGAALSP